MDKKFIFLIIGMFLVLGIVGATETKQIDYTLQLKYSKANCEEVCTSQIVNGTSNETINNTVCGEECDLIFDIRSLPLDKHTIIPTRIDTSSDQFKDKEGQWIDLYGTYVAELGNNTDITGLNDKLDNLTTIYENLMKCQSSLRNYDFNLSNCITQTGYATNYSLETCGTEKANLQKTVSEKDKRISELQEQYDKEKGSKQTWGFLGILIGVALIKFIIPTIQGKETPKDSSEEQFPSNQGY